MQFDGRGCVGLNLGLSRAGGWAQTRGDYLELFHPTDLTLIALDLILKSVLQKRLLNNKMVNHLGLRTD